jgi:ADP-ribosylglycohydrolase
MTPLADRAAGAIMGALVGDALGLGPHWYYDLDEQRREYGPWINGYTTPKPGHYHAGMQAGQLSQTGLIIALLLRSMAECGGYEQSDFTRRLDEQLLPFLNGQPKFGPGGYTNQSLRETWVKRVKLGKPWGECAGLADTSEAAERGVVIAARYAADPVAAATQAAANCRLTQNDTGTAAQCVGFAAVVAALVRGVPLDENLSDTLMEPLRSGKLLFKYETPAQSGAGAETDRSLGFASPDALLLADWCAQAAKDPGVRIEPAWKVSLVYGMACATQFVLPAAYYLAARFPDDFESAVLHALNGGGQNMSRACLTGALAGAQVGLAGIPQRFIDGLENGAELTDLARRVGAQAG